MKVPIHNAGELIHNADELDIYLGDYDGEIYLTVETNDHTRSDTVYSMSINELNRYISQFKSSKNNKSTT